MTGHQIRATVAILGVGIVLASVILLAPASPGAGDEVPGEQHVEAPQPSGPHGGRLFEEGSLSIEMTIFEAGVEPELRLYPYVDGRPADPAGPDLVARVHRLGGVVDTLRFEPTGDFLRSTSSLYEPHSFRIELDGVWDGVPVSWTHESVEGRVHMPQAQAEASGVVMGIAGPGSIRSSLALPGEVQLNADRLARVSARVSGTVVAVHSDLGAAVRAGSELASIESRELGDAQHTYIESLHRLELAQTTYQRERRLWERRISAEQDYLRARHGLEEAELGKQSAEQALVALGVPPAQFHALGVEPEGPVEQEREVRAPLPTSLTRHVIRSPLNGEVIGRDLSIGEHVDGAREAFTVADLSTVRVELTVYADDMDRVGAGQAVTVYARPDDAGGAVGQGVLNYVGPLVGESTRTARALVTLANPARDGIRPWRPGMFVTAEVVLSEDLVPVTVAREAVQEWRGMPVVFARFGDAFEVRPVATGRSDGRLVEITDGLEAGQPYAAEGAYLLKADLEKSSASHDH
jgi:cobalt-zinc-cadmium efflux system membrane fusion protein